MECFKFIIKELDCFDGEQQPLDSNLLCFIIIIKSSAFERPSQQ